MESQAQRLWLSLVVRPRYTRMDIVHFQLTNSELLRSTLRRRLLRQSFLARVALLLILGALLLTIGGQAELFGYFCLVSAVGLPFWRYVALQRFLQQNRRYTAPTSAEFDEAGITFSGADFRNHLAWSGFPSWRETPDYILLFVTANEQQAVTLPKRAFTPEQIQRFLSYVRRIGA